MTTKLDIIKITIIAATIITVLLILPCAAKQVINTIYDNNAGGNNNNYPIVPTDMYIQPMIPTPIPQGEIDDLYRRIEQSDVDIDEILRALEYIDNMRK